MQPCVVSHSLLNAKSKWGAGDGLAGSSNKAVISHLTPAAALQVHSHLAFNHPGAGRDLKDRGSQVLEVRKGRLGPLCCAAEPGFMPAPGCVSASLHFSSYRTASLE